MEQGLPAVKGFIQQVVEAIAAAIGIEVMVFDLNRNIVAGTGETRVQVGHRFNKGSLTGRVLEHGQPLVARTPGQSLECMSCSRYGTCSRYIVAAFPITVKEKVLGSFCLVAINNQQKDIILANEDGLLRFLERMCLLIASAISERQIQQELNIMLNKYDNVVNSVHEGIISTDYVGNVIHLNRSAINLLGIDNEEIIGKQLTKLFPEFPDIKTFTKHKSTEIEISYSLKKKKKRYFLAVVVPVLTGENGNIQGITISFRNLSEVQSYATKLVGYGKYSFDDILGDSQCVLEVKSKLRRAALTDATILIRGESGTGKELFAHAVHNYSRRSQGPFVAINCSAIPESLLESELFGYEEGAFTGARKGGKPGKFELARGGTLFLDEIGDMPLHLQSKLLRVLENHSIERVGGTDTIPIDVRIIAATNRNLEEMIDKYEFRSDLYYRLSVIPVVIPPLRERKEDIFILIKYFLEKYCNKLDRECQILDECARERLYRYPWYGNVRELQNAIEYAISMSEPGQTILLEHLPQSLLAYHDELVNDVELSGDEAKGKGLKDNREPTTRLRAMEIEAIREALKKFGTTTEGKEKAAQFLGISLATLYRRLKDNEIIS
ncbi:Nitrogen fixation protein VnfA [Pelotomaculum schinkii]|uniref:Nitrogen fixation protein VnfA n=1 Tax=Pelotomaculum schinkii TaxID=78350 RepID=A0A4Y7R6H9_9FIRM|nr:sigma 54-interacting transcriptional regulator [Pelotomaculum schinkii]TEB04457.1 Nitrogen fixation protein VnfA [Pelotomaculum schinkii]